MIALIISVCLVSDPFVCKDVPLMLPDISYVQCIIQGQQLSAEWRQQNPKWHFVGWKCRGEDNGKDA